MKMSMCNKAYDVFSRSTKDLMLCVLLRDNKVVGKISGKPSLTQKFYHVSVLIFFPEYQDGYTVTISCMDKSKTTAFNEGVRECFRALKGDLNKIGIELQEENIRGNLIIELAKLGLILRVVCGAS